MIIKGKTVLITGGTSGIGLEAATQPVFPENSFWLS